MSLTKELVKEARIRLIDSIDIWMKNPDVELSALQIATWTKAAKSNNSDEMCAIFQQEGFPLVHQNNTEQLDDFFDDEVQSTVIIKKTYACLYENNDSCMDKLRQLTNLVEYLFQLEELLTPLETAQQLAQSLRPIQLAEEMAKSILSEWRFVEPGRDSLKHYEARLSVVDKQLQSAQETINGSIEMELTNVDKKIQQFHRVIQRLASNLQELFAMEKDERYCVRLLGFRLLAYTHWHEMLISLATRLYEDVRVSSQDINVLEIPAADLERLKTSYHLSYKNPVNNLNHELNSNLQQAKISINAAKKTINAMKSQLQAEETVGLDWHLNKLSVTTTPYTPYNFFKILRDLKSSQEEKATYQFRQ